LAGGLTVVLERREVAIKKISFWAEGSWVGGIVVHLKKSTLAYASGILRCRSLLKFEFDDSETGYPRSSRSGQPRSYPRRNRRRISLVFRWIDCIWYGAAGLAAVP
jgi:hypothetical protein